LPSIEMMVKLTADDLELRLAKKHRNWQFYVMWSSLFC